MDDIFQGKSITTIQSNILITKSQQWVSVEGIMVLWAMYFLNVVVSFLCDTDEEIESEKDIIEQRVDL